MTKRPDSRLYKIECFLKKKAVKELTLTDKQIQEVTKVLEYLKEDNEKTLKTSSTIVVLIRMLKHGVDNLMVRRLIKGIKMGRGLSLKKCVIAR